MNNQKQKKREVKKEIFLHASKANGISLIKNLLNNLDVKYLAAGKYLITSEAKDLKTADNNLKIILEEIAKKAKQQDVEFAIK